MNIVFIHNGIDEYLKLSLLCAKRSNPNANIFLIGTENIKGLNFIEFFDIKNYSIGADLFAQYYKHLSRNNYNFELFCIQRWFILKDFLKDRNLNKCFYADSDVLIFTNLEEDQIKFSKFDFTLSENTCGHNSFWNNQEAIIKFCEFTMQLYKKENIADYILINKYWDMCQLNNTTNGVSDMTLFNIFKSKNLNRIGESTKIINMTTYDNNINLCHNNGIIFKNIFGFKYISWDNGTPYCQMLNGNRVKFKTLHFQGSAKKYMKKAYNGKTFLPFKILFKKIFYTILHFFNIDILYINYRKKIK